MAKFNTGQMVQDRRGNLYRVEGYHSAPQLDGTPMVLLTELHPEDYRDNTVGTFKLPEDVLREYSTIHKTVREAAERYQVPIGRDRNGYYYIRDRESGKVLFWSFYPTAKSGLTIIRKYRRMMEDRKGA